MNIHTKKGDLTAAALRSGMTDYKIFRRRSINNPYVNVKLAFRLGRYYVDAYSDTTRLSGETYDKLIPARERFHELIDALGHAINNEYLK